MGVCTGVCYTPVIVSAHTHVSHHKYVEKYQNTTFVVITWGFQAQNAPKPVSVNSARALPLVPLTGGAYDAGRSHRLYSRLERGTITSLYIPLPSTPLVFRTPL